MKQHAILWLIIIVVVLAIMIPADIMLWNVRVGGLPIFEIVGIVLTVCLMVAAGGKAFEVAGGAAVKTGMGIMEIRQKNRELRTPTVLAQHQNFVLFADPRGRTKTYDGVQSGVVVREESQRAVARYQYETQAINTRVEWEARTAIENIQSQANIMISRYKFEIEQLALERQREADAARIRIQEARMQGQLLLSAMRARTLALPQPTGDGAQQQQDQVPPTTVDLLDVLGFWRPSPDELLLGVVIRQGQYVPLVVHPKKGEHVGILGSTGNGKTNIERLTVAQLCLWRNNWVYLISPHYADIKADGTDWTPIRKRLKAYPCKSGEEIESLLVWAVEELNDRCTREGNRDFTWKDHDIYIAVDELPEVVKRYPGAPEKLDTLLRRGRAYGIYIVNASQDFLVKTTGSGSAVREQYHTIFYVGGDEHSARKMLNVTGAIEREGELGHDGLIYLRSRATPRAVYCRYPLASNAGIELLMGFADGETTSTEDGSGESSDGPTTSSMAKITELFPLPPKTKSGPQTVVSPEERQEIITYFLNQGLNRTQIASTMGYNGEEYRLVKQVLDQFITQTVLTLYVQDASVEQMLAALRYSPGNTRARNIVERILAVATRAQEGLTVPQIMASLRTQPGDEKAREYVTAIVREYEAVMERRQAGGQGDGVGEGLPVDEEDEERVSGE
jgi:hypothetical protein